MRILSISLGLAAISCVVAQAAPEQGAADPLAPANAQTVYAWSEDSGESSKKPLTPEEFADAVSEIRFRADILDLIESYRTTFEAASVPDAPPKPKCEDLTDAIAKVMDVIRVPVEQIGTSVPFLKVTLNTLLATVASLSTLTLTTVTAPVLQSVGAAVKVIGAILGTLYFIPGLSAITVPVNNLLDTVHTTLNCLAGGQFRLLVDSSLCYHIADFYRIAVAESVKANPALNLPESVSDDIRRLTAGSLSVLDLMEKHAISPTNEGLLAVRPIFATDLLNQYREELLRSDSPDIKNYAEGQLAFVVGVSNALEACLRVAADPVAAIDDLNEELDAEDQDEDEDEDEDQDAAEGADESDVIEDHQ
ncbi:hypothetical protein BGZ94_009038 [Podila epigama]|nr:hypothetical protein BGZ94_009038 [Podila epigama]